jgi:hypothetical protein
MRRYAWLVVLLLAAPTMGCVERRYIIQSDPPGALVYRNGRYLGATPVDDWIVYYGKYDFVLVKEGYETLHVVQRYPPPWYELPGLDFISENVVPFKLRDVRCFHYTMQPLQTVAPGEVLGRADELRTRAQGIGAPAPPRPVGPPPGGPQPEPPAVPPVPLPQGAPGDTLPVPRPVPPG